MKTSNIVNVIYDEVLNSYSFEISYRGKIWSFYYNDNICDSISRTLRDKVYEAIDLSLFEDVLPYSSTLKYKTIEDSFVKSHLVRIINLYYSASKDANFVASFVDSSKYFVINRKIAKFTSK